MRLLTAAISAVCHLAVLLAVVGAPADAPLRIDPPTVQVRLVELRPEPPAPPAPKPGPEPSAPALEPTKPAPKRPHKVPARKPTAQTDVPTTPLDAAPPGPSAADVSDAELASAASVAAAGVGAGHGSGGGATCDMLAWLQRKLRDDRRVQAAMAAVHDGRAIRVWNGDWVRHPGQDGNGLAAVREAIMWEVAFAPEACRAQRVQGLVQVSLTDAPGSARVVMGSPDWRWSDVVTRSRR